MTEADERHGWSPKKITISVAIGLVVIFAAIQLVPTGTITPTPR